MTNRRKKHYMNMILVVLISYIGIQLIDHIGWIASQISDIINLIKPFIIAFIIAYVLSPMINALEKKFKFSRKKSISITYLGIIGVGSVFISYILPVITSNISELFKNMPTFSKTAQDYIGYWIEKSRTLKIGNFSQMLQDHIQSYVPKLSNLFIFSLDSLLKETIAITTSFLSVLFGFIISVYILIDKEHFIRFLKKLLYVIFKKKNGDRILDLGRNVDKMIGIYIGAKSLDSLIVAIIAFVGMIMFSAKYALLLAFIIGITNMIPYFGPVIGMGITFVIQLFYSPMNALWILVFLVTLQQFDGWYLDPKLTGKKVGMNPFLAILSVTLGGGLIGIPGMILGIPIMAVIKVYTDLLIEKYYKKI